jgi:serine/threonine protein kinase
MQYIVTSTLGQGTFGKVKLATHQETGQECAFPRPLLSNAARSTHPRITLPLRIACMYGVSDFSY